MAKSNSAFQTIRTEGALFPPDILQRIASLKVDGTRLDDYHLPPGFKVKEAITASWTALRAHWTNFQEARANLDNEDTGTAITNDRWLLPLFKELEYGRLPTDRAPVIDDKTYPIERFYNNTPIHLIGCNLVLDRRTKGARGAATASPHSMMQEFLNRSDDHLWAFVSNGRHLRILRDNISLSRQAFVEFDLEAMMEGEVYSDFALLWLLCHQSRVEANQPEQCWLEIWSQLAREQGTRILKELRSGVEKSIEALGQGFISHPRNDQLREKLQTGELTKDDYYRQLLRIVYRLLFLFVAEDRELLHPAKVNSTAADLYDTYYSTRRLREMSQRIRGSKHADLWHSLSLVFNSLGKDAGCPQLGLIGLGSFLWRSESTVDLNGPAAISHRASAPRSSAEITDSSDPVYISNDDLLLSIRALAYVEQDRVLRSVDYRNLGSEELGSVYESLLELHPQMHVEAKTFSLSTAAGNERKTTGSYYTPDSLVQCLLDSALEPVVEQRLKEAKTISRSKITLPAEGLDAASTRERKRELPHWIDRVPANRRDLLILGNYTQIAEQAILALTVCDPACGSGHFLIAAAHRLARHLARIRTGESEPSPEDHQHALRDIIGRCIYGVDINPMAVELCKVSLWMEAIEPGKPLSFLDHHIQCGNSLLGATPKLLSDGIPNDAFKPIEGDDKEVCKDLKKRNARERSDAEHGGIQQELWNRSDGIKLGNMAETFARLSAGDDHTVEAIRQKELEYAKAVRGDKYKYSCLLADLWCAAFLWKKDETELGRLCPTQYYLKEVEKNPHSIPKAMEAEVKRLAEQYALFHWHLAYPDVCMLPETAGKPENEQTGWSLGFDVVLGNPPWEKLQTEELQFFAARNPHITSLKGATRKNAITKLKETDSSLAAAWLFQRRHDAAAVSFIRSSDRYPLTGVGKFNTFALFAELNRELISGDGHVGCIVQSDIASSDTCKLFFGDIVKRRSLLSFHDFVNTEGIFPGIHRTHPHFCLLTMRRHGASQDATYSFWNTNTRNLADDERRFRLSPTDIARINPNTLTCPVFRNRRDAALTSNVYARLEILLNEGTNAVNFYQPKVWRLLNTTDDSEHFTSREGDVPTIPVLEAKGVHQFDHRYAAYSETSGEYEVVDASEKQDSNATHVARHYISEAMLEERLPIELATKGWFSTVRNITNTTNERTVIATHTPRVASCEVTPYVETTGGAPTNSFLVGALNSFAMDYVARQKIAGTHLSYYILYQLPVPQSETQLLGFGFFLARLLELTYTAWDLEAFASDCGYDGSPFHWNEERRFLLRCELDAAYFHLYLGKPEEWGTDNTELREMFPTPRDAVEYIMETFPIVKRKDIARTEVKNEAGEVVTPGTYITKDTILEIYDEMATAIATGVPYQTRLDPPPGPPTDADGNFIPMAQWDQNNWPSHIHPPRESGTVPVPVTPARTATPASVTRVPGIAASLDGKFPVSDAQKLAVGLAADLAVRFSGSQETAIRQYLGLATNPEAIEKLLAGEDKALEFAAAVDELSDAFHQINADAAPWPKVFNALEKNDAIKATDTEPAIVSAGSESKAVIEHFGTLPDAYMRLVLSAIKSLQSTAAEEMGDDDARFISEAQKPWLTESTG